MHQYRFYLVDGLLLPVPYTLDSYASERCGALRGTIESSEFLQGVFRADTNDRDLTFARSLSTSAPIGQAHCLKLPFSPPCVAMSDHIFQAHASSVRRAERAMILQDLDVAFPVPHASSHLYVPRMYACGLLDPTTGLEWPGGLQQLLHPLFRYRKSTSSVIISRNMPHTTDVEW
jgi:hypothetical protein